MYCIFTSISFRIAINILAKSRRNETKHESEKTKFRQDFAKFRFATKWNNFILGKPTPLPVLLVGQTEWEKWGRKGGMGVGVGGLHLVTRRNKKYGQTENDDSAFRSELCFVFDRDTLLYFQLIYQTYLRTVSKHQQ